jgi:hypothetical protein
MSKQDENMQYDAKPFNDRQRAILDSDNRIRSYWTEAHDLGGRVLWISLAPGFNYEGRHNVVANTWRDVVHNLKAVEAGEPFA